MRASVGHHHHQHHLPPTATSRSSSSNLKRSSTPDLLLPCSVSLPPSPPATDTLLPDDDEEEQQQLSSDFESHSPPSTLTKKKLRPSTYSTLQKARGDNSLESITARLKRSRPPSSSCSSAPFDPFSSPTNSPTTRKSLARSQHQSKKLRKEDRDDQPKPRDTFRDSPNNPFLVQSNERPKRPGVNRDESHRKLVYVFRGKRVQYDTGEDIDQSGQSPFNLSGPKLLFPSPPSPRPQRSSNTIEPNNPTVNSGPSCSTFQTPTKKADGGRKPRPDDLRMLPTPQSRPRTKRNGANNHISQVMR